MADDLATVTHKLDAARRAYMEAEANLDRLLPAASGPHDIAKHLLSHAEEYGVEKALADLAANPGFFDLASVPAGVGPALEGVYKASQACDLLMGKREALLGRKFPRHERSFFMQGETLTVDMREGKARIVERNVEVPVPAELVPRVRGRQRDRDHEK